MSSKDVNNYATIKTVAQSALNISLISSNIFSIKHAVDLGKHLKYHEAIISLAAISLALNLLIGLLLIILGAFFDMKKGLKLRPEKNKTQKLSPTTKMFNAIITGLIAFSTVINIGLSIFQSSS